MYSMSTSQIPARPHERAMHAKNYKRFKTNYTNQDTPPFRYLREPGQTDTIVLWSGEMAVHVMGPECPTPTYNKTGFLFFFLNLQYKHLFTKRYNPKIYGTATIAHGIRALYNNMKRVPYQSYNKIMLSC